MLQADSDKLLRRRLYVQRFVTSVFNDVAKSNRPLDRELINTIVEFVADADEKTLFALSQQRTSNADAAALLAAIREIIKQQATAAAALVKGHAIQLIESEAAVTTAAMGETATPSVRGVASLPISGTALAVIIPAAYALYAKRLLSEVTKSAGTGPADIVRTIRGTRAEGYKNGLLRWRDDRLLRPNVDGIINGAASNAAEHVFKGFQVVQVDHLATLDYRTCARCYAAEMNGPYDIGTQPRIQIHPDCRCINIPHTGDDVRRERGFVKDDRSVKDIPQAYPGDKTRGGKIGTTRDNIEQFFGRMSDADRRDYMGKTRFELYKAGKIDIGDLVKERTLRPLRLDELPGL